MDPLAALRQSRLAASAFLRDTRGQDLIEYALLAATIGVAGAAAMNLVQDGMLASYASWDESAQNAWEMPDPQP